MFFCPCGKKVLAAKPDNLSSTPVLTAELSFVQPSGTEVQQLSRDAPSLQCQIATTEASILTGDASAGSQPLRWCTAIAGLPILVPAANLPNPLGYTFILFALSL